MIYDEVDKSAPIRQGDIFSDIPIPYIDTIKLNVPSKDGAKFLEKSWKEIIGLIPKDKFPIRSFVSIERSFAIVISQDCDCLRNNYLSLFRIQLCDRIIKKTSPKSIFKEILNINRKTDYLMYLPRDNDELFPGPMQINFGSQISIKREDLNSLLDLRLFRLNAESMEHFRDKANHYYLRYSYTESYPFDNVQFNAYKEEREKDNPEEELDPRDYQV